MAELHWSPATFWSATPTEFVTAYEYLERRAAASRP
jgi:hypothetical protein